MKYMRNSQSDQQVTELKSTLQSAQKEMKDQMYRMIAQLME